ncbi:hypothetical protein MHYP_G00204710 [Metynnis hypsauchen]
MLYLGRGQPPVGALPVVPPSDPPLILTVEETGVWYAAESYEIRWSERLEILQKTFSDANPVNTSALQPQEAGSDEQFSFLPGVTIQNGSTLFFAVRSEDKEAMKSEVSNIARVTKFVPTPRPPEISNPGLNVTAIVVSVCVVIIMVCFIAFVAKWAMKRKKASREV